MSEAINIIKKAVNTNFKEPLNKLIEKSHSEIINKANTTSGCSINPALEYTTAPTFDSNRTRPYLVDNDGEVITNDSIGGSYRIIKYDTELWKTYKSDSVFYLVMMNLITGINTIKYTFTGTTVKLFAVTETYVYGYETISSVNYLFRYNKLTGEYVRSVNAIDSFFITNYDILCFLTYGDTLHAYFLTTSTTDTKKGYYEITDILDYGGAFSYTKLNDTIPELVEGSSYVFNSCTQQILELEDNFILYVAQYYYISASYRLLKINIETGESSYIKGGSGSSENFLCPIEHEGKLVGILFGSTNNYIQLLEIKGSEIYDKSVSLMTSGTLFGIFYYKDDMVYICAITGETLIKDANLMVCDTNYVCYIPKGTKYYNSEIDRVLKVIPKLRDSISIEDDEIKYTGYVECNEDHVFEFTEGGFYFIPGSFYNSMISNKRGLIFHLNGTFF